MALSDCRIISLPRIEDKRGCLTYVESLNHIPFSMNRVYYIYDLPSGAHRAGHAHKSLHQLFLVMSGSFDVRLSDGESTACFHMNRPFTGLYVCPMIWRDLDNFSPGSVCLVLASDFFDEGDYYRDFGEFLEARAKL